MIFSEHKLQPHNQSAEGYGPLVPFFKFFFFFGFLNFNDFFFIFVNIEPHGSEDLKTLLPRQLLFFSYIFPVTVLTNLDYRNFEISNLIFLTEIFLNMGPHGSDNFKTLLLLQF